MDIDNEVTQVTTNSTPAPSEAPVITDDIVEAQTDDGADQGEVDEDAELRAIYRKHNAERDESGRFRSTKPAQEGGEAQDEVSQDQPPVEEPKQAVAPAIQPPSTWSAEEKAEWDKLPPKAQEAIARRDREAQQALSKQGNELKAVEPVRNVIEQHRDVFERHGLTPDDGISRLIAVERMLETDPDTAIVQIAQAYGVDLGQFGNQPGTQQAPLPPEQAQLYQRIHWLENQLNETQTRMSAREQAETDARVQSVSSMIEKFSADKPYWSDLETDVHAEIIGINAAIAQGVMEAMPPEARLAKAYERALWNNPQVRARMQAEETRKKQEQQVAEARKRAEDAKRARVVNITSSPARSAVPSSMDDTLREAYRQATSKG